MKHTALLIIALGCLGVSFYWGRHHPLLNDEHCFVGWHTVYFDQERIEMKDKLPPPFTGDVFMGSWACAMGESK